MFIFVTNVTSIQPLVFRLKLSNWWGWVHGGNSRYFQVNDEKYFGGCAPIFLIVIECYYLFQNLIKNKIISLISVNGGKGGGGAQTFFKT